MSATTTIQHNGVKEGKRGRKRVIEGVREGFIFLCVSAGGRERENEKEMHAPLFIKIPTHPGSEIPGYF